jgi:pimeloyl-ACP methyl ester carboxylesterase
MKKIILLLVTSLVGFNTYSQKIAAKLDQEFSITLDKGTLYGSLLVPKSKNPVPVVLIIPGSGPTDRNCNSALGLKTDAFIYLSEGLYKHKIATLRIDKRASGKSAATFGMALLDTKFQDYLTDVEQWVNLLKNDPRFSEVYIAGHSEGSMFGMLAAKNLGATGFISLAGPGRPIDVILHEQLNVSLPHLSDSTRMFLDSLKLGKYMHNGPLVLRQTLSINNAEYLTDWMQIDPAKVFAEISIPLLVINGDNDIQVPAKDAELLHQANPKSKLVIIPKMNHVLKDAPYDRLGNFETYNQPKLPINQQLIKEMASFVLSK